MALTALFLSSVAYAQNGSVNVTAKIVGSYLLTIQDSATTTSAPGNVTATVTLGSVSSMQSAPAGFTLLRATQQSSISSQIKVSAVKANMPNTNYALTAQLQHALPSGVTWRLNGVALTDQNSTAVSTADFGSAQDLSLQITVDKSASNVTLDNAIIFAVVPK